MLHEVSDTLLLCFQSLQYGRASNVESQRVVATKIQTHILVEANDVDQKGECAVRQHKIQKVLQYMRVVFDRPPNPSLWS
jgi:hypothetical protein